MAASLRTVLLTGACALTSAAAAFAQPALTGEAVLVNAAGPHAVAHGGASTAFGGDLFDVALQPAVLGEWQSFEIGFAAERERFALENPELWSFGVVVPLHQLRRSLPSVSVHHRRLRASTALEFTSFGQTRRFELDYATGSTALAAGWRMGADPRSTRGTGGAIGTVLHVVESGGELRTTQAGTVGDTTRTVVPGLDDLLFAATIGAMGWWSRPAGDGSSLQIRAGAVWRRAGEESDAFSATLRLTNLGGAALDALGFDPASIERPVMASEVAAGAGLRWNAPQARLTVQADVAQPVHAGSRAPAAWRWGAELRLLDVLHLRAGGADDLRLRDLVGGIGVELPLPSGWHVGLDLAFEPSRFEEVNQDAAMVWGVRIGGPLPRGRDPEERDGLDDLLDEIDRWLDETPPDVDPIPGGGR
jgi:hypothetical protein